ncbi:Serine/threonine phosphatase stp [compost metagenome]
MGTTVVAAVFTHDRLVVAHLGDSRAYLWRCGTLRQLTHDHSWLQEQIDAGLLSPAAAARSTQGHLITRALGVTPQARPTLREVRLEAGDRVLLCSDGLSNMLSAATMATLLATPLPLETQAQRLVDKANAQGGRDNISLILVAVDGPQA